MITEAEMAAKSDTELLQIWLNQVDYLPEVVTWAKAEIDKRGIDVGTVVLKTERDVQVASLVGAAKTMAFLQGFGAILLLPAQQNLWVDSGSGSRPNV